MKLNIIVVLLILCGLSLAACESLPHNRDGSIESAATSFEDAYAAAEKALAAAEASRNAWSRTDGLMRAAKVANNEGRVEEATSLATEAKMQAELAVIQAEREKKTWQTRVLGQ